MPRRSIRADAERPPLEPISSTDFGFGVATGFGVAAATAVGVATGAGAFAGTSGAFAASACFAFACGTSISPAPLSAPENRNS